MKKLIFIVLVLLLFYTRFTNLEWGLPYPMHPDERNMAVAVQQLSCPSLTSLFSNIQSPITCFNPHFFAYGQFPLYLAYGEVQLFHLGTGQTGQPTFIEAVRALRIISVLSSVFLVFVSLKIIELFFSKRKPLTTNYQLLAVLFFIFQPYAIQFAHFGTTESLLMLFYALIIYFSLKLLLIKDQPLATLIYLGIFSGLALGTKTSSLLFLGVPLAILCIKIIGGSRGRAPANATLPASQARAMVGRKTTDRIYYFCQLIVYLPITLIFFILSSPQSFLNWNDFISSMNYESAIGLGTYIPFYTRQFVGTTPIVFQILKILPYTLGWPTFILGILGFLLLPSYIGKKIIYPFLKFWSEPKTYDKAPASRLRRVWSSFRERQIESESSALFDILRFTLLLSFLPPSFFFAKWTRFIAPTFPLFSLFALLFLFHIFYSIKYKKLVGLLLLVLIGMIINGIAYLSIYNSPDVRFTASNWIYKNIPEGSKILSETANVIDIPIPSPQFEEKTKNYLLNSFNFYDLDAVPQLQKDLSEALNMADYIIVPSRRIFANHPKDTYPYLSKYYEDLFSGILGFEKVAEFSSYPTLKFQVSSFKFQIPFPDENAEETWTVFDHPVIRIYKKTANPSSLPRGKNQTQITSLKTDFSSYKTTNYQLLTTSLNLLIADTPEKWEKGLMYVKNKQDINGLDGMIFIFPTAQPLTFWNKNTLSHLTLYWIENKQVVGVSDLPSVTETGAVITVSSPKSADTVLEIIK